MCRYFPKCFTDTDKTIDLHSSQNSPTTKVPWPPSSPFYRCEHGGTLLVRSEIKCESRQSGSRASNHCLSWPPLWELRKWYPAGIRDVSTVTGLVEWWPLNLDGTRPAELSVEGFDHPAPTRPVKVLDNGLHEKRRFCYKDRSTCPHVPANWGQSWDHPGAFLTQWAECLSISQDLKCFPRFLSTKDLPNIQDPLAAHESSQVLTSNAA